VSKEKGIGPSAGDDGVEGRDQSGGGDAGGPGRGRYQLDSDGQFVAVTDGFADLTGRTRESLLGSHVTTVLDEGDTDRYEVAVGKLGRGGELPETTLAVRLRTADGEAVPCQLTLTALAGAESGWRSLGVVTPTETAVTAGVDRDTLYEEIIENAPETAFLIDSDRQVSYVSEDIEGYFEGGTTELTPQPLEAATKETIAHEDERQEYLELVDELLAGNRSEGQMTVTLETPTGEQPVGDIRLSTIEADGEGAMVVGLSRDSTEQVEQRRELRRERDLNDQLLETAPIGITVHAADGTITRTNERAETILGLAKSQLDGHHCEELSCTFRDEDGAEIPIEQLPSQRVIETEQPVFGRELQVVHPDGEKRWMKANAAPVFGPDGELDRVVGAFSDVTDHREHERELEAERAFTEAVLDSVPDMVYAFDDDGRFVRWNDQVAAITGYDEDELADKHVLDFIAETDHEMVWDAIEGVYEGSVERRETQLVTRDGRKIPYEFSAAPIVDQDGELFGFAGVGRDISDQKARERRLREQNERLERLNRINAVIRDIDQVLVSASTRAEIEQAVCERLAAADTYQFAWIGTEQQTNGTITASAMAGGADEYLDEVTVRTDDSPHGRGPGGRAYRTREVQVCQDVGDAPGFESVRDTVDAFGFRSVASIPIVYEDTLYGVLSVYADEPFSFGEIEQAVLGELGETIGHAISGLQAKRALVTERVTELTVDISDSDRFVFALSERADCTLAFEGGVFQSDGELLYYITVEGTDAERIRAVAAEFDYVDHLRIVSEYDGVCVVEMGPPVQSTMETVTDHGGSITDATVSDGTATVTVELPETSDVSELLSALRSRFDDVTLVSQRDAERSVQTHHQFRETVTERLTERQQAALEVAYYADYFDWPRGSTGEELADTLDVSAPTFHKHLRLAERTLIETILDDVRSANRH